MSLKLKIIWLNLCVVNNAVCYDSKLLFVERKKEEIQTRTCLESSTSQRLTFKSHKSGKMKTEKICISETTDVREAKPGKICWGEGDEEE